MCTRVCMRVRTYTRTRMRNSRNLKSGRGSVWSGRGEGETWTTRETDVSERRFKR